jgi:hypothetical protein
MGAGYEPKLCAGCVVGINRIFGKWESIKLTVRPEGGDDGLYSGGTLVAVLVPEKECEFPPHVETRRLYAALQISETALKDKERDLYEARTMLHGKNWRPQS